jgi:hypothetical protein
MDGWIDEVRISNKGRSADWVAAQYLSMINRFITFGPESTNSWWNNNWQYRLGLQFDNGQQGETLVNFPVLVTLDLSNFNYSKVKADGSDIRFIDEDGTTELKYHMEKWNPSGESHIWVNVTKIEGSSSHDSIWMYYGNPLAGNSQDVSGTYDTDFMGVWHLNESSGTLYDATSNDHHGTQSGGVTYGATGQVDGAVNFDGNDDMVSVPDDPELEPPNDMTIEAWVNFEVLSSTLGRPQTPVAKRHSVAPWQSYELLLNSGDNFRFGWANSSGPNEYAGWNGPPMLNTWYYIVGVKDGDTLRFYLDGGTSGCFTNTAEGTMLQSDFALRIGDDEGEVIFGTVDEVRLSDIARSADWIKAQYLSMRNNFISFGLEETLRPDSGAAYLFFGYPGISTSDLSADSANVTIYGSNPKDLFAWSLSDAGDHNGDSYSDIIIGAPGYDNGRGRIYIFYGKDSSAWGDQIEADLDADYIITGENIGDRFGYAVSNAGDLGREGYFQSWLYRKRITIMANQVTADLTDFPVVLQTVDMDLARSARPNGFDIVFTEDDGVTILDFEIETYNGVTGELVAWVRIPFLSSTANTVLYMYYGNQDSWDHSNSEGVWDAGYAGVWHLTETGDGTFGEFEDSTSYDNNGQGGSGIPQNVPARITGKIGSGQSFDGIEDHINCGNNTSLNIGGNEITLEAWINYSGYDPTHYLGIMAHDGWNQGYRLVIRENGDPLYFHLPEDTYWLGATQNTPTNSWAHVVGVYDGSAMKIYINGIQDTNTLAKSDNIEICPNEFWIGHGDNEVGQPFSYPWDGMIDEVRVSSIARSSDWIATQFNNQNDIDSFCIFRNEEIVAENWYYSKPITIHSSQVPSDLIDFPVLIELSGSDLKDKARSDGSDIIFTAMDGRSKLDFEMESYDPLTGNLMAWVRIPFLSSISDTLIYIYYGNPEAWNLENEEAVWKNGYVGVYHMKEDSGNIENSASSTNDGTRQNTPTRNVGQIGYGTDFSGGGADDYFNLGDLGIADGVNTNITFSTWAYIRDADLEDWGKIISKRNDADTKYVYHISFDDDSSDKDVACYVNNDGSSYVPIVKETWVYITLTYDGTRRLLYANTTEILNDGGSSGPISSSSAGVTLGSRPFSQNFGGILDEVRFSDVVRSPSWIETEYNNQRDPSSFYSVGPIIGGKKYTEIIIGAPGFSNEKGRAYLFLGNPSISGEVPPTSARVIINGTLDGDRFGESLAGEGNVDNYEYDDMIIGGPGANLNDGRAYIFFGIHPLKQNCNSEDADVVITGGVGSEFGFSISNSNDLNFDGFDDIIVGAPKNGGDTGAVYVFYGSGSLLTSLSILDSDVSMYGTSPGDMFGYSIDASTDMNMDGFPDLAIGAPNYDNGASLNSGAIYIFEGGSPMDGTSDWVIFGEGSNDHFGWSLSYSGDINGDSLVYIIVTAPQNDIGAQNAGRLYIVSGSYKPLISNVMASPPTQFSGGIINVSCDVVAPYGIDTVWVNITVPGGGSLNQSMTLGTGDTWFLSQAYWQLGSYQFTIWANNTLGEWSQSNVFTFDIVNQVPSLSFGHVNPSSGYVDTSFNFAVQYTDLDDHPPDRIMVNITGYGTFDLTQSDPFDLDYTDGKDYDIDISGFPIGIYTFHFAANDTSSAWIESGAYQFNVINRDPSFSNEQVNPISGNIDDEFNFTVIYWDMDDHPPDIIKVNITDLGEFDLIELDPADTIYTDGKSYYYKLTGFAQGQHEFKFAANDILGSWTESGNLQFYVENRPPYLSSDLVIPQSGYTNDWFNFSVIYNDLDDQPPGTISVNITNYGVMELYELDPLDINYMDGKDYYLNISLPQGSYTFHFAANDITGEWGLETPEVGYPSVSPRPGTLEIWDMVIEFGDAIFLNASIYDNLANPIARENISYYIDFNSNGVFETEELVGVRESSTMGMISLQYPSSISRGTYNYSVEYTGSADYIVPDDRALLSIIPKQGTLTASIVAVEAGQTAFLNATLLDDDGQPISNEYVALYLDKNRDGFYQGSEVIVTLSTTVNGLASINYYINLQPENYGFWAKYEGSNNYEVNEIKGLVTVQSTGNIPPTILGIVDDQIRFEDSLPWTLDLTQHEDDVEDFGGNLKWYIEGENSELYTVTGENSTDDVLTFIPKENAFGSDEVMLYLVDSGGSWDSQRLWINLTPVNDVPTFDPLPPDIFVRYDDPSDPLDDPNPWDYTFYVHDIETPVEDLVITTSQPTSNTGNGYVEVDGLMVTYHYPQTRVGDSIFVFLELSDGEDSVQTMIVVNVTSDWIPELSSEIPDIVMYENSLLHNAFDLDDFFFDKDQDVIYYSSGNDNIIVRINENNSVDISAPAQWVGTELVTFRAMDPTGAIVEDTIMVTVLPVNDGPQIANVPDLVVHYDYSYSFDLSPYIQDPDNLTTELLLWSSESSQFIDLQPSNNLGIVINYPESFNGMKIPITLYVTDGLEMSSQNITISVSHYFPPEVVENLPDVYFDEDTILENAFVLSDYFLDVDSNILFYSNGSNMINVTILKDLSVKFTAPLHWYGMEKVTFRATDSEGAIAEDTVSVYVVPINDAPTIEVISRQESESGDEWVLDLSEYIHDVDNEKSELMISVDSLYGSDYVSLVGHVLIFRYPNDVNEDYVSVTVSDGEHEAKTGFIVAIKSKEPLAPSIWDLIPWQWVFSTIFISLVGALVVYTKTTKYKVYEAFLIHEKGLSIGHASKEERSELEDIIVSGMFIAVQDFIGDTFSGKSPEDWELDEMTFGDNKIMVERRERLFLAVVFEGNGKRLRLRIKRLLGDINNDFGQIFEDWNGDMSYLDGINMALMELITKGKAPNKEPKNIPVKPKQKPEIVKAEPVLKPKETLLVKPDANLKELNEIINWGKELTKIENITGDVTLENQDGESGLAERYECPICGIEVAEGIIFCPNCKARFSQPKE